MRQKNRFDKAELDSADVIVSIPKSALTVVAPHPELVSQRNAEQVLGIPKRAYLDAIGAFRAGGGIVTSLGKLRLVDRAAFVSWLRRPRRGIPVPANDGGADAVLSELGLRRVGGRR